MEWQMIGGQLFWDDHAGKGTMKGREEPITLQGKYLMKWLPYLIVEEKKNEQFQALLVEVINIK